MIDLPAVQNLLARWWFDYDAGNAGEWPSYFTAGARFSCRSDTGNSPVEKFLGADLRGREEIVAWHREHRRLSPDPLRHHATSVHLPGAPGPGATPGAEPGAEPETGFRSYLLVTVVAEGRAVPSASGLCLGAVQYEDGEPRFADLRVILDFTDSRTPEP